MKKTAFLLSIIVLLSSCTMYGVLGKQMDKQTLPELIAVRKDDIKYVTLDVVKETSVVGIPSKGFLPKKSQYVVPLPFVGFFGANVILQPGTPTLVSPLYENLQTALKGEIENQFPKTATNNYTLRLRVDSSNFSFRYHKKGWLVWIFIIQFGHKKEWCSPSDLSLSVSYELSENGKLIKSGIVTKDQHNADKILSTTPVPEAKPYNPLDPMDSPSNAMVRQQDQFAFGGAAGTIAQGFNYNLAAYNVLIQDVAKQVISEVKPTIK